MICMGMMPVRAWLLSSTDDNLINHLIIYFHSFYVRAICGLCHNIVNSVYACTHVQLDRRVATHVSMRRPVDHAH